MRTISTKEGRLASKQSFNIQYPVKLFGQPTGMTCWSAATTMLFGSQFSAGPGSAALGATGGLKPDTNNIQSFARSYNLRLNYPQSWTVEGLTHLLQRGPVVLMGAIPSLHAVVIGGIRGDSTSGSAELTIYDPWPPNQGRVYTVNYQSFMTQFPMATMYLLQR